MTGFEPATSCSQSTHTNQLYYIPIWLFIFYLNLLTKQQKDVADISQLCWSTPTRTENATAKRLCVTITP